MNLLILEQIDAWTRSILAGEGATVIINGRSEKWVIEAIGKIRQKHARAKLEPLIGDL